MFRTARFATPTLRMQQGDEAAFGGTSPCRTGINDQHSLRQRLACIVATALSALGSLAAIAQDGISMLPPDAREAGAAYRKLIAADNNVAKNVAVERRNYEEAETPKSRCSEAARQFCSDLANAQFEFKPFKALLPDVPKLTPHNVYIRRNKITVAYTFK